MQTFRFAAGLIAVALSLGAGPERPAGAWAQSDPFLGAAANGARVDELLGRARRVLHAWLRHADPDTLLLPDYLATFPSPGGPRPLVYTPHNSAADNYPYLITTAW